jgi:hypothetical protein
MFCNLYFPSSIKKFFGILYYGINEDLYTFFSVVGRIKQESLTYWLSQDVEGTLQKRAVIYCALARYVFTLSSASTVYCAPLFFVRAELLMMTIITLLTFLPGGHAIMYIQSDLLLFH